MQEYQRYIRPCTGNGELPKQQYVEYEISNGEIRITGCNFVQDGNHCGANPQVTTICSVYENAQKPFSPQPSLPPIHSQSIELKPKAPSSSPSQKAEDIKCLLAANIDPNVISESIGVSIEEVQTVINQFDFENKPKYI